jgi:seryl-tRNA synthetase
MGTEDLQDMLDKLHDELSKLKVADEELKDQLEQIMVDIEVFLDESGDTGEHHRDNLVRRIKRIVDDFEISHPDMTSTLGEMASSLSRMGF